jgi:hypothetical protein
MKTRNLIPFVLLLSTQAFAFEGIVRQYQSVRSSGMGGVRITTGLYEENFFGNPARATANPKWKVGLPDPTVEVNGNSISTAGDLAGDGGISTIANTSGDNNHARVQLTFPSFYIPPGEEGNWGWGFGVIFSIQADVSLRNSFTAVTEAVMDAGPAFTAAYRGILDDKSLSVGITAKAMGRATGKPETSVADVLRDPGEIITAEDAKRGVSIDFDLGATYKLPYKIDEIDFTVGASINNLLGGKFDHFAVSEFANGTKNPPKAQPRTLGFGVAVHQPTMWVFSDPVAALEFTDIGNNPDGSLFKTVHLGMELTYGRLRPRFGVNQGYFTGGLSADLTAILIELATYGEEISTNVGARQDRRFAVRLGFQI